MQTNNFDSTNSNNNEDNIINPEQAPVENLVPGETSSETQSTAKIDEIENRIVELESEIKKDKENINVVRAELALPPGNVADIPSLSKKISTLDKLNKYLTNTAKAVTMAGVMLAGSGEATAQANKTPVKNPEKTEVKTEVSSFYNRLQEYKITPNSMTASEFQEKVKDEEWLTSVTNQYREVRGIMSPDKAKEWNKNNPNAKVIQSTIYNYDTSKEKKVLSEDERKKELEDVWKKVSQGNLKMGDSVTLSNGEIYVIKKYTPNTYKKSTTKNQSDSSLATSTRFMKDRFDN
jgi:hypothetical protein